VIYSRSHVCSNNITKILGSGYGYTSHDAGKINHWACSSSSTILLVA